MYALDPSAGNNWLQALRQQPEEGIMYVSRLLPSLREASDGSTEILTTIILKDAVMNLPSPQRRQLLAGLENQLKKIILGGPYAGLGWPLVGFMTEAEAAHETGRY